MPRFDHRTSSSSKNPRRVVIVGLCLMTGLAIAGPSGFFAWHENAQLREQRAERLAVLVESRDTLRHKVNLLDPDHADPDLVSELIRRNLNVVHPDEVIVTLNPEGD